MSATATSSFYVTGGTLRQNAPSYVERQADKDLYAGLLRGEFCYVLTSRQMGKSSLMVHTAARLRSAGIAVAVLDLTAIGQNLSIEQWYGGLLRRVGLQLDPSGALEEALDDFWFAQEARLGPLERWMTALRQLVLPAVGVQVFRPGTRAAGDGVQEAPTSEPERRNARTPERPSPLVLFIDEIDAVRSLPFSTDEFFAAIRECYNRRSQDPEFERLTFCLLGVATPSDLIQDMRTTPFNIGRRIELTDFTADEAEPLAVGLLDRRDAEATENSQSDMSGLSSATTLRPLRLCGEEGSRLLQRILYWTGGHPYLTQRLSQAVAANPKSGIHHPKSEVDRLCSALFLAPSVREQDDNLLFVRERLLKSEADRAGLLDLYAQVRAGRAVGVDDTNPLVDRLRLAGITRVMSGRLRVRNRIYERVFDRQWVTTHMPDAELRRQRAAYRRGLLRASAIAAGVVAVMAGLAGAALHQSALARGAAARAHRESARGSRLLYLANMNLIQQDWANSNIGRMRSSLEQTRDNPERGFEWAYWERLCHLDLMSVAADPSGVRLVAYSPDGTRLLTDSVEGTANVWDARTGRSLLTIREALQAAFSPNGERIAAISAEGQVTIYQADTGRKILTFSSREPGYWRAFAFDGRRLVTSDQSGTATVWEIASGRARAVLTLQDPAEPPTTGQAAPDFVRTAVLSPDGRRIATVRLGGSTTLWDARTGQKLYTLPGHLSVATALAFSPDGARLATGSPGQAVVVRDARTGKPLRTLRLLTGGAFALAFSRDGRRLAVGKSDGTAAVWNLATGQVLILKGHAMSVNTVAFSPDGRQVVTGSMDGTAKIWDATVDRAGPVFEWRDPSLTCAALSPDGTKVAAGRTDGTVEVRAIGSPASSARRLRLPVAQTLPGQRRGSSGPGITAVAYSPDGQWIIAGSADGTGVVWDSTGRRLFVLKGHTAAIRTVAVSPAGRRLLTGSEDGTARVWDPARGGDGNARELFKLSDLGTQVRALFSPDGRRIVTAATAPGVRLWAWDAGTGHELFPFPDSGWVGSAAFSPDGRYLLTGGSPSPGQDNVIVWELATGRIKLSFPEPARLWAVAFSPDGRRLVTAGLDRSGGVLRLWDVETRRETLSLRADRPFVSSVTFSRDGRRLLATSGAAASGGEQTVQVWEAASASQIAVWEESEHGAADRPFRWDSLDVASQGFWARDVLLQRARAAERDQAAGQTALARSDRQRAREIVLGELTRQPPRAKVLNEVAWVCAMHDLFLPEALKAAQRAHALRPRDPNILDTLAEVHFRMRQWDQAIEIETRAAALDPLFQGTLFRYLARGAKEDAAAGRREQARNKLRQVSETVRRELTHRPPDAVALDRVASNCVTNDFCLPEALKASQRAVALQPRSADFLNTLAELHFHLGHRAQAIEFETRALALAPTVQDFKDRLARDRKGKP